LLSVDAGVAVMDEELRVTAWNGHAYDLWGLHADEVQGQHLANLDIGLPVDDVLPVIRAVLAGDGTPQQLVIRARTRRGKEIDCRVRFSQLLAPDRSVSGVIVLMEAV